MKKTLCAILATICTLAVTAGFPPHSEAQSKKVVVQLAWVIGGLHSGFFVAKEKGFYASKGLDVAINRGFGSGDTAKVVATGTAHFGEVNVPTAIISRGKELPLTVVGVIIGKAPESILSFADKGIRKPKDVEGKTFAEASGAAIMVTWPAFAKLAGIDISKATHIPVEAAAKPAVFFSGQVDWVPGFRPGFDEPLIIRARKEGKKLHFIRWEDFGWKVYGNGLVTNNDLLKREPKTVANFVAATMEGYAYAIAHPDEALDITLKANPELDRESARLSLLFAIDAMITQASQEHGLGYMEEDRMAFQIKLMSDLMKFTLPKDVYTNQFIQKKSVTVPTALAAELKKLP
ncbi:MAG TPA: ABC transporter substrate-binding protein [Candidatus Nitrosocosmicus sp.]|nr:ABC transporter substrate-binding protein [Candidatus Nitrosocosmicus sp.]